MPASSLTSGRTPVEATSMDASGELKEVAWANWNSYLVALPTGLQENAGVRLVMVAPLTGEPIAETCAPRGAMVKLRFSEYGLYTGELTLTFQ